MLLDSPNAHLGVITANLAALGAIAPGASDTARFEVEVSEASCLEPGSVTATAASPTATSAVHTGAASGGPGLGFYGVVAVAADGVTEGAN